VRRIIAMILTLVLANVSVASALNCDDAATKMRSQPASTHDAGHGHEHHSQVPDTPRQDTSGSACCEAMLSCVSTADLTTERVASETPAHADESPRGAVMVPLTRDVAPEPPPPRG
jgi:hypothetical protein